MMCRPRKEVETVKRQIPRVTLTEGTEETIIDLEEVLAKRSRRGVPRKPRVPRKKPLPAYIQLSPALQSELRKLQHAAARGSSASAAEWAKVSRAADKALALLLLDKGPKSMELSTVYKCQDIGFECELEKEQSGSTQWLHAKTVRVFGLIPHLKTKLRVLNIVDAASEMHIAIHNLIVRRWDRCKNNVSYLRQMGEFQTVSDELTDAKEQLRMASLAERDDPDERSKHGVPKQ